MSSVPNIVGIKLSDVTAVVGGASLNGAFTNSVDACFNATYKGNKDRLSNFRDYNTARAQLAIGDAYQGGIIAYLLQYGDLGYDANTQHGLIMAETDLSAGIQWSNGSNIHVGLYNEIGYGNYNTNRIITAQGAGTYAASICANLSLNNYDDWYLPSSVEMMMLYAYYHSTGLGNFVSDGLYWTSNEWIDYPSSNGRIIYFANGTHDSWPKWYTQPRVRAIRSF